MKKRSCLPRAIGLLTILALTLMSGLLSQENPPAAQQKFSAPGKYQVYSAPVYSEYVRTSPRAFARTQGVDPS